METEMKESMMLSREKYWSELTDPEKIDRMRQIVKRLEGEVGFLRSRLETLQDHVHVGEHLYTRQQGYRIGEIEPTLRGPKDDKVFF